MTVPISAEAPITLAPSTGVVGALEDAWNSFVAPHPTASPLHVDLENVGYVDVPGMVFLVSRFVERTRAGGKMSIRLPASDSVLRILRAWRFEEAIERTCGWGFDQVLDNESYRRWQGTASTPHGVREMLPENYFPIQPVMRASHSFDRVLAEEWSDSWRRSYVLTVLDKMLGDRGNYVATHIIHEAIMNGVRHPWARILLTASGSRTFEQDEGRRTSRYLTICVWDDGESIISTLRRATQAATVLRPRKSALLERDVVLHRHVAGTSGAQRTRLTNQDDVDAESDDGMLLVAATFPGVTSDLDASEGFAHVDVVKSNPAFALPGMGLFVLATAVAETFGGKLTIRADRYRLSITRDRAAPESSPTLGYKLTELPSAASMLGNQITIRIPRETLSAE